MMNKFDIALCAALATAMGGNAQSAKMYENFAIHKASPDGNWIVENVQGTMAILNATTGKTYTLSDDNLLELYSPGLGNSVTNGGRIYGFTMKRALVWDNGEVLQIDDEPTGIGTGYNGIMSATPDETILVGGLGNNDASSSSDGMLAYPVIWTKGGDGKYVCTKLPHLTRDFAGSIPQSIIAQQVSDDGTVIAGTLTSGNGFFTFPNVFRKDAEGNWTSVLLGKNNVYDESRLSELPDVPVEPEQPDKYGYMSESEKEAYDAAYSKYEEDLALYQNGETDTEPTMPNPTDYMGDATLKAKYISDVQEYYKAHEAYMALWVKYSEALSNITTGNKFRKNNMFLSPNGRYLATALQEDGVYIPGYFDLTEEDPQFVKAADNTCSMTVTSVLDDGTIFAATPVTELTRSTYVMEKGKSPVPFSEFLTKKSAAAGAWLAANNTYDVDSYDDDGTQTGVKNDSIVSGTVTASGNGRVFTAYYTDYFTGDGQTTKSYVINLDGVNSIGGVASDDRGNNLSMMVFGKTIAIGGTKTAQAYDMTGRSVATTKEGELTIGQPGVYVVTMTGGNGERKSRKVVIK